MAAAAKDKSEEKPEGGKSLLADLAGLGKLWPHLKADKRLIVLAGIMIPLISAVETGGPLILKNAIDIGR